MRPACRLHYRGLDLELVEDVLHIARGERIQRLKLWEDRTMQILDSKNGQYFDGIDVSNAFNGRWFKCRSALILTLTAELELVGGGNISGEIFGEFTADPLEAKGIAPLTMPDGSLMSSLAGVVWTAPGQKLVLTSVLSGAFGLTFAFPVAGSVRFRWKPTNIAGLAAGVSKLTVFAQLSEDL
jgi:hypothetical protein